MKHNNDDVTMGRGLVYC